MNWKVLLAALGILAVTPCAVMWAVADDDVEDIEDEEDEDYEDEDEADVPTGEGRVVARMTCDDIKVKLAELKTQVNANPDLQGELDDLLKKQRSQCARSSRARPVKNLNNAMPQMEEPAEEEVVEEVVVEKPKKKKKEAVTEEETKVVEEAPAEPTPKELEAKRAEFAAKGLCPDGAKPNRYGCCEGEKFKDLGNLKFACCMKDDEKNCHPALTKQ